jgi:hypothetical protein
MNTRPLLILLGTSLLAGCVYPYQSYGYAAPGYSPAAAYSPVYQSAYQPGYQTGYQSAYQPAQTTYQSYPYRAAPGPYPLYSPQFPQSGVNGGDGG